MLDFRQSLTNTYKSVTPRECMALVSLEHSKVAYRADFVLYCTVTVALTAFLLVFGQRDQRLELAAVVLLGLVSWTVIEYALHRFILHGLQPFRRWHTGHHVRPRALICAPTVLSGALIATLVYLPALLVWNQWIADALTLGLLAGYLTYSVIHHAAHHWRAETDWLKRRKSWHALHHQHVDHPRCYGVTTTFWDYVFGSAHRYPPCRTGPPVSSSQ